MPHRIGYLHAIGGVALGLLLLVVGSGDARNEFKIQRKGITIEASVGSWRTLKDDFLQTSYQVQYTFTLPGDKSIYSRTDTTDRSHLWSVVPEEVWNKSKQTGKLPVVYLASNPKANRPEQPGGYVTVDLIVAVCFGAILTTGSLVLLFVLVFKRVAPTVVRY